VFIKNSFDNTIILQSHNLKSPTKILIIQTAFLGDVVLTTPLIRETKRLFPNAQLDVLVIPQTKGVLQNNPHINSLIIFNKRQNRLFSFFLTIYKLRRTRYDLCLLPHRSGTSARIAAYANIPRRIGFDGRRPARFYTDRVFFDRSKNQINRLLDLLRFLKPINYKAHTEIFLSPELEETAVDHLQPLKEYPIKMAIAPGSVWNTKRWPEPYFAELIKKLVKHEVGIVLIGSQAEKELCDRIAQTTGQANILNLAGQTGLLQVAAIIQKCDLLICNDSGSLHIANAVQTDVFAFFGPTVQRFGFAPFRPNDKVFEIDLDCRPCASHGGKKCPQGHFRCMLDVKPEVVYSQVCDKFGLT
jgi:heptosyltransferase-2